VSDASEALVFDTGPLRHFAVNGWLGVLRFLAGDRTVLIPESVEAELLRQVREIPALRQVLEAHWVVVDRSDDTQYLAAFAQFENLLVVDGTTNQGECGVLALGSTRGFEMVLDDSVPRQIAVDRGLQVTATLPLLCKAIREGKLTVPMVASLADDLIIGEYFLPFEEGQFQRWALEQGLIEYA
jgi:predicted nucleic acid-binding protein